MLYDSQKNQILDILEDLKKYSYINPNGGSISIRCNKDHILATPTGSSFRRWNIKKQDLVVFDLKGKIIEKGKYLADAETPMLITIYSMFKKCNACIHVHLPHSLFFACNNESIPSVTNLSDTLGEIPCLYSDDLNIKRQFNKKNVKIKALPCMIQRDDVAAIYKLNIIPAFIKKFKSRAEEMNHHGMAFTIYKHGLFVFARNLDECFENLVRVEINAKVAVYKSFLRKI